MTYELNWTMGYVAGQMAGTAKSVTSVFDTAEQAWKSYRSMLSMQDTQITCRDEQQESRYLVTNVNEPVPSGKGFDPSLPKDRTMSTNNSTLKARNTAQSLIDSVGGKQACVTLFHRMQSALAGDGDLDSQSEGWRFASACFTWAVRLHIRETRGG